MTSDAHTAITIVDYGMGNLRSVSKALDHLGYKNQVTHHAEAIRRADRLILPGVGAFGDAMAALNEYGIVEPIKEFVKSGRPFLGICLGMQLLMDGSEESPGVEGLGLIEGQVRRFEIDRKVPHMGWNRVREIQPCPLFSGLNSDDYFYFVHSFYCDPEGDGTVAVAGTTDYDIEFCSVLWKDNVMATQFHPEKSQECGLHILSNFAGI